MHKYRIEKDSLGAIKVPGNSYWGAQTQRALANFPISGMVFSPQFIRSIVLVKRSCAGVNKELGLLDSRLADAIIRSCDEVLRGKLSGQFPLDIFQTGSGTSTNMNVNEVLAARANEILTGKKNTKAPVHANDHVNMGQSSNDVIPSAIHISSYLLVKESLLPAMGRLHTSINRIQKRYGAVVKTGRTHLMDATPITLGQEFSGWGAQVEHSLERIQGALPRLSELALGGTAVGTGLNTPKLFSGQVIRKISAMTGVKFKEAKNHFEAQSAQDSIADLSGRLKTYATILMKISNDLRWMNSGPIAGLAEIRLPALQPGSSIMPGKVNPVIPEAARMVAAQVIGNDTVISLCNASGEFQLNVMLPLIAHSIIQSITILANVSSLLADKAISNLEVNEVHLAQLVAKNPVIATALNPVIGYDKAAAVVKKALKEKKTIRQVVLEMNYLSPEEADRVLNPAALTRHGKGRKNRI